MQVNWLADILIAKCQSHWRGCFVLFYPRPSLSTLFVPEGYRLSHAMKMRRPRALVPDSSSQLSPRTISILPSHLRISKLLSSFQKPGNGSSRTFKKEQTLRLWLLRAYLHWSVSKDPAPWKERPLRLQGQVCSTYWKMALLMSSSLSLPALQFPSLRRDPFCMVKVKMSFACLQTLPYFAEVGTGSEIFDTVEREKKWNFEMKLILLGQGHFLMGCLFASILLYWTPPAPQRYFSGL